MHSSQCRTQRQPRAAALIDWLAVSRLRHSNAAAARANGSRVLQYHQAAQWVQIVKYEPQPEAASSAPRVSLKGAAAGKLCSYMAATTLEGAWLME